MELSAEDNLKLNVLIANAQAIRINEGNLCVYGLTGEAEAKIQLHPTCGPDRYIRAVRELLATHALGSPRGYPVYLKRWTRLGEMQNTRLEPLLKLGEDEAVVAVARTPGITDELSRRIWWALPTAEVARYLLEHRQVAQGPMGRILAEFLVEFLPFEEETAAVIHTVRLVLQPGLIDTEALQAIWQRAARKPHFYVGFLHTIPNELPEQRPHHEHYHTARLRLSASEDRFTRQLVRLLSGPGQAFLITCERVLRKPLDQDVVVSLLEALWEYMRDARIEEDGFQDIAALSDFANGAAPLRRSAELQALIDAAPELAPQLRAMLLLAHAGEPLVRPVFARTDAVGSVMRGKLEHITTPLRAAIETLRAVA